MKRAVVLGLALGFIVTGTLGAQEAEEKEDMWAPRAAWGGSAPDASAGTAGEEAEPAPKPKQTGWVRGEVVEASSKAVVVEHYDYKVGGKVRTRVKVVEETVFNGVPAAASIEPGMFAAIDYEVNASGAAVARVVAVNTEGGADWGIVQ